MPIRQYTSEHGGKCGSDETRTPEQTRRLCVTQPLMQARPISISAPPSCQVLPGPKTEPFDKSTQALFKAIYDKLPLDHAKYTKIVEIPNEYALLLKEDVYVLVIQCRMFDFHKLTFPLNPEDATKVLASRNELESHVQELQSNVAIHYIFSLEGVNEMRRTLDPDYQPL